MTTLLKLGGLAGCLLVASIALAQRPGGDNAERGNDGGASDLVNRMFAFDTDKDGKLTRSEITDERLLRLFDRADADKNGTVTRDELTALASREASAARQGARGGPGGFGGPGGGPPPRPGEVLPAMLQQRLGLSAEQRSQVEALQKDVDARLDTILNDDQKTQLKQMRQRGPGGPGGRPPGGPPPGGPGPR